MAKQSTFLCTCGRVMSRLTADRSDLPWNQERGMPTMRSIMCGSCGQNFMWVKPKGGNWVDVKRCCTDFECGCWK